MNTVPRLVRTSCDVSLYWLSIDRDGALCDATILLHIRDLLIIITRLFSRSFLCSICTSFEPTTSVALPTSSPWRRMFDVSIETWTLNFVSVSQTLWRRPIYSNRVVSPYSVHTSVLEVKEMSLGHLKSSWNVGQILYWQLDWRLYFDSSGTNIIISESIANFIFFFLRQTTRLSSSVTRDKHIWRPTAIRIMILAL